MRPLRVVILDNMAAQWNNAQARELFNMMVGMKLAGYQRAHGANTLPVDQTDFVCTHLLACEEVNGELRPVCGHKAITIDRCREYKLRFPLLNLLESSGIPASIGQEIMDELDTEGVRYSYDSSWTKNNNDPALAALLRDMVPLMIVGHHIVDDIKGWFTIGVERFKTDRTFEWMGSEPITPTFPLASLHGDLTRVFFGREFSKESLKMVTEKYADLWKHRLELRPDPNAGRWKQDAILLDKLADQIRKNIASHPGGHSPSF